VSWLVEPAPIAAIVAVALYTLGARRRLRLVGAIDPEWRWRGGSFVAGTAAIVFVLGPAFDRWADELLWAHMLQHVVLMSVAPPLIVLGAPWLPVWRGLPLGARRPVARFAIGLPAVVRGAFRSLRNPYVVFALGCSDLALWHLPALYDATLRSASTHYVEHALFVAVGLLFWLQVLDSPPLHPRLTPLWRAGYATAGAATGWLLAIVLALAPTPIYAAYASQAHRPGGISALADQQLAAGVMIGVGAIPFSLAVFILIYRWLDGDPPPRTRRRISVVACSSSGLPPLGRSRQLEDVLELSGAGEAVGQAANRGQRGDDADGQQEVPENDSGHVQLLSS
jgi:putative membrane protein